MAAERAERRGWLRWAGSIAVAAGTLALVSVAAPLVEVRGVGMLILAAVATFGCVAVETLGVAAVTPQITRRSTLALVPVGAALAVTAVFGGVLSPVHSAMLVTSALLAGGSIIGALVGQSIEEAGHLLVVAAVSAVVDAFSVFHALGPTAQLVEVETAVQVLLLPWPLMGTEEIRPVLGVGDVVFVSLYLAASRRHGLSSRRTLMALAGGLGATMIVAIASARGVPALPFLGAGMLAAHPAARRLPRQEWGRAALGLSALTLAIAISFWIR